MSKKNISSANFLNIGRKHSAYKDSRVVVLPVPYEETVSYMKGAAKGPGAIIKASHYLERYDDELGKEFYAVGIHTLSPFSPASKRTPPAEFIKRLSERVESLIKDRKFIVTLGGEHSITSGVIKAYLKKYPRMSVLQIDAHSDLRNTYQGTGYSHACVMRRVIDMCSAVQVGIRSLSKEEANFIKSRKLKVFFAHKIKKSNKKDWIKKVVQGLTKDVYITIDLDGFDPSLVPATGTPEPGGLFWDETIDMLHAVFRSKNVVGFDIVELAPRKDSTNSDYIAAKLAYKMISYKFSK